MHKRRTGGEHVCAFLRTHSLIPLAEAFASDEDEIDLVGGRINGAPHPFFVQGEGDVAGRLIAIEATKNQRAIGHFWHRFRRHERAGFHSFDAARFEPGNEFELLIRAEISWIILQAIARPDFYDINTSCHAACLTGIEGE